jgi:hypothetical protein
VTSPDADPSPAKRMWARARQTKANPLLRGVSTSASRVVVLGYFHAG